MKYYRWGFNNQDYNDQFYVSSGGFEKPHPKHSYGPMGRSGYMIHCITGGTGIFVYNQRTYHLKKGDFFFIKPHKLSYMEADEKDPWSFYWVRFVGNLVAKYISRINFTDQNVVLKQADFPLIFQDVIDINEFSKSSGPRDFYYQTKLFDILQHLQTAFPNENQQNKFLQGSDIYQKAYRYLQNNYDDQITVRDLVSYLNIDRTYLYRIFKKYSHQSPQKFITNYRLEKASELLKDSSNSIEYTALSCGFSSYQSFIRFFKKKYNISPSQYQKNFN